MSSQSKKRNRPSEDEFSDQNYDRNDVARIFRLYSNLKHRKEDPSYSDSFKLNTNEVVEILKEEGADHDTIEEVLNAYHEQKQKNEVINMNPVKKISEAAAGLESKLLKLEKHTKQNNFETTAIVHNESGDIRSEYDLIYGVEVKKNESISIKVTFRDYHLREEPLYTVKLRSNPEIEKLKSKVRELTDHPLHKYSIYGHLAFAGAIGLADPILGVSTFVSTYGILSRGAWDSSIIDDIFIGDRLFKEEETVKFHKSENTASKYKPKLKEMRNAKLHDHFVRPFKLIGYHAKKVRPSAFKQPKIMIYSNQDGKANTVEEYIGELRKINGDDPQRAKFITESLNSLAKTVNYELGKSTQFLNDLN